MYAIKNIWYDKDIHGFTFTYAFLKIFAIIKILRKFAIIFYVIL